MSFLAAASIGLNVLGKGYSAYSSFRQSKDMSRKEKEYARMVRELEGSRQAIINPYEDVSNPFTNLGVATGAAKMQAEEQDISLANTLDMLSSSGYSAGGATAIAQAALRGKRDIANSIEQQEVRNQELRARGQQAMEMAQAQGREFEFLARERRENQMLSRYAGLEQGYQQQAAMAQQRAIGSLASLGSDLSNLGTGYFTGLQ